MKSSRSGKDNFEADVDRFVEELAAAGVSCARDRVAWFVNLHHRSEPFWASLLYLAKEGRKWGVSFTFSGERNEPAIEALCSRFGFPAAEARLFALNVADAEQATAA